MQQSMNTSSLNISEDRETPIVKKTKKTSKIPRDGDPLAGDVKKKPKKKLNKANGQPKSALGTEPDMDNQENTLPKSDFDTIWDPEQLAPKIGERNGSQLSTIGEEFAPLKMARTKSYLGGKVAKLDDEHISSLSSNLDATNKPINFKKKDKSQTNVNTGSTDDFNRAQSSTSSLI